MRIRVLLYKFVGQSVVRQNFPLFLRVFKKLRYMIYIFIVALEFLLAFVGVALLVRFYNHKA